MGKSNIELAVDVLVAALQSGKLPSYQPDDVALYLDTIYKQICSSTAKQDSEASSAEVPY